MDMRSGLRPRIDELDILRGLAFLAVVFQHTVGIYIRKPDVGILEASVMGLLFNLSKFAVPMFVFITGIVLFFNYYQCFDYRRFIFKRVLEILIPYAVWTAIYNYFYLHSKGLTNDEWLKSFDEALFLGEAAYHLWYIVMIFQFYLFYPLIRQVFRQMNNEIIRYRLLVLTAVSLGYIFLMWAAREHSGIFGTGLIGDWFVGYRSRNALFYIFYFVLGAFAGLDINWWRSITVRYWKIGLCLFLIFFVWVGVELLAGESVNLNISTSLKTSMFLYTVVQIVLLYNLAIVIVQRFPQVFSLLALAGKYSFGAYLMHALALDYTVRILYTVIPTTRYLIPTLGSFIICSMVSIILTRLISSTPFGFIITGFRR